MPSLTEVVALELANFIADRTDTGGAATVRFYSGAVPADADEALVAQVELAAVTLNVPSYDDAGMVGSDAIAALSTSPNYPFNTVDTGGTPTFARIEDGNNLVRRQWTVTTGGSGDVDLDIGALTAGQMLRLQ